MKVLHLISSAGMYGAEVMLLNLARGLMAARCEVIVGVFHNLKNPHFELANQLKVCRVHVETVPCRGRLDPSAALRIRRLIRVLEIDLVHSHGYKADVYTFLATRFSPTPILATSHNWTGRDEVPSLYNKLDRLLLRAFCRVAAVAEGVADKLRESGVASHKVIGIANGLDLASFEAIGPKRGTVLKKKDGVVIGMVGRLVKQKGCDYFLRAAAEVLSHFPNTRFLLVGDGPEKANLLRLTRDLGIQENVAFLGHCSDMLSVYASMDFCVLPSFLEGMPMTVIEAMAAGRPIVASSVGEIPKMVTHEVDGLLAEPGDVSGLSVAMTRLIRDANLRLKMSENARTKAKNSFSAEAMARAYLSLYHQILEERQNHSVYTCERT